MKSAEEWLFGDSWQGVDIEYVRKIQADALKSIEETSERLRAFCVDNPFSVRNVPDSIWVPFCDSLLEAQKLIASLNKKEP